MAPKSDTESATPTVCIDCPRDHVRYAGPLLGCVTKYQARPRKKRDEEARTSVSGGKGRKRKWEAELAVLAAATGRGHSPIHDSSINDSSPRPRGEQARETVLRLMSKIRVRHTEG